MRKRCLHAGMHLGRWNGCRWTLSNGFGDNGDRDDASSVVHPERTQISSFVVSMCLRLHKLAIHLLVRGVRVRVRVRVARAHARAYVCVCMYACVCVYVCVPAYSTQHKRLWALGGWRRVVLI